MAPHVEGRLPRGDEMPHLVNPGGNVRPFPVSSSTANLQLCRVPVRTRRQALAARLADRQPALRMRSTGATDSPDDVVPTRQLRSGDGIRGELRSSPTTHVHWKDREL